MIFLDGPLAKPLTNGDHLRHLEVTQAYAQVDVFSDNRIGFCTGVNAEKLHAQPKMRMPLKHRDIFEQFDLS